MALTEDIQDILNKLQVFEKMYEHIRFVDPLKKDIIIIGSNQNFATAATSKKCYEIWGKGKICDNCISIRAFNENQTFVKIEYTSERIYMITAIPYEVNNRRIVIELLKDTTNSMIFGNGDYESNSSGIYAVIDNLNILALKDPLTGLYNRRYINEKLPIDLINAALSQQSLSIIMADLDFFKKVNDTYGHIAGDCVLKIFAETLQDCIKRESDWVSRYGGEEFLICLPGAGIERTTEIAENIRASIAEKEIPCGEHTIHITASFGICNVKPSEGDSIEQMIECADKKLYLAKNNGRNRVEF